MIHRLGFGFFLFQLCFSGITLGAAPIEGIDIVTQTQVRVDPARSKKATVLCFLSAHCPCSSSHEPVLKELYSKFSGPDFQFLGIHSNADENTKETLEHFKASGLPFSVIQDAKMKIADRFGALKTPHIFILSPKGEVLYSGGVDDSHVASASRKHYLLDALESLKVGKKIETTSTRVLGCTIQRK